MRQSIQHVPVENKMLSEGTWGEGLRIHGCVFDGFRVMRRLLVLVLQILQVNFDQCCLYKQCKLGWRHGLMKERCKMVLEYMQGKVRV